MRKWFVTWAAIAMVLVLATPVLAQTPTPNEINAVARDLWCPLCNGVRLDNCDLQACLQMKEVIAQKLVAGESAEQIKAYFVTQYGDVVLGQPSREGFNLIVWLFPVLAAVVGLGWVVYLVLSWRKRQEQTIRLDRPAGPASATRRPGEEGDDYLKRVEREMRETE